MNQASGVVLLTVRGQLKAASVEEARRIHNETAGSAQVMTVAKSLGDLSHNVYVPLQDPPEQATELLIVDLWNNPGGLQQFFAQHEVQQGGALNFASMEPVVWGPADELPSLELPTPAGKNERFLGTLRGTVRSRAAAREAFSELVKERTNAARRHGLVSKQLFFRMAAPGTPEALELFALDTWMDAEGMAKFYANPNEMEPFKELFTAPPVASVWKRPAGLWAEW